MSASLDASYINKKEDFALFQENRTAECNLHVPALNHIYLQRLCKDLDGESDGESLWPASLWDVKVFGTDSVMTAIGHFFSIPRVKAGSSSSSSVRAWARARGSSTTDLLTYVLTNRAILLTGPSSTVALPRYLFVTPT